MARSTHRLDEIVTDFPKPPTDPTPHPQPSAITDLPSRPNTSNALSSQESHNTDKENAPPATPPRPPVPSFAAPSDPQTIPHDINTFYSSIRTTLSKNFAKHPPHTIQRLAELVLEPKKRYRFLPPYLRALDRVISVSSPLTIFPLPQAILPTASGLLNGTTSSTPQPAPLGSDEALGGALLTPIPWLQNRGQNELISESTEMVDGPNGAGRIETVTVGMLASNAQRAASPTNVAQIASSHPDGETLPSTGPVTQGELLRQEQEAGIVLNNPHSMNASPTKTAFAEAEGGGTIMETVEGEEEAPHARGPEVIGMEDTGPQKQGKLDIEGAIGRPSVDQKSPDPTAGAESKKKEDESDKAEAAQGDAGEETKDDANAKEKGAEKQDVEMKSDD
ncbi:protein phosphatase 4 core regulatory subunit r2 protein [Stemphylium lycopersici]|uniref:Protein phosphatase 4 core regulatory subunit r2 protein n=1 Tax=Stemphylium lycopersici TaxID=183478 RepID=A0A364MUB6_STELY|nr:protein phosphatase 4 core regulatory subunit r2 protein [Stemphylium lycopersici]RAR03885.1 protein phosphatase 4 core regulatory subunit r2 protein [Stemphylium lycopersici]